MKTTLFHTLLIPLFSLLTLHLSAQDKGNRPSPPAQAKASVEGISVAIDYSQPSVKKRKVWGGLVPYGEVWRTGANEATWIEFSDDVLINGQPLDKGKYALFTIPDENGWTVIFNRTWNQWGAYDYNENEDALRVNVSTVKSKKYNERMNFSINPKGEVVLAWENLMTSFDIDKP